MRIILQLFLAGILSVSQVLHITAQTSIDFNKVKLESEKVAGNVSMIKMVGAHASNVGVIAGKNHTLIVDSQYPQMTQRLVDEVAKLSNKPITYLVNTHYHGDHTSGNANFSKLGVTIIAHENVRKVMSVPRKSIVTGKINPASPEAALPQITYSKALELELDNEVVRVIHVPPSHTSGDSFIHYTGSNVLQMGDTYRTTSYPIVDPSDGGTYSGLLKVMNMAIEMSDEDTKIIPGHGHVSDRKELMVLRDMMKSIQGRVDSMIKEGKSLKEIIKAKPTAEFDQRWGFPEGHFMSEEKMLTLIYQEIAGN